MELFLVKPNLGNPLIIQPEELINGITLCFASKTNERPSSREFFLKLRHNCILQLKRLDRTADFGLRFMEVVSTGDIYSRPRRDFPITSEDHQYKVGFRWAYEVKVKYTGPLSAIREPQGWPQIFDIYYAEGDTHSNKTNYHAIYVDEKMPTSDKFTLIHLTDLHVAGRNDRIPEVLSEVRDKIEYSKLLARYNNFNNNLRAVIKYANEKLGKGDPVVLVATGDLTDYYHDGFFKKGNKSTSNFAKLVEILTNQDGKGEPLKCPIFTVLGNHDYLHYETPLAFDINVLLGLIKRDRDSYKAFGLTHNEGREYDYWMRGCPGWPPGTGGGLIPSELWSTTPEIERRRYIKVHGGWDVDLDSDEAYSLGKPRYKHLECYLEMINYETDFKFSIGPHQFVCLNTGQDRYPRKRDFFRDATIGGVSDYKKDYIEGGPHNRGISDEHLTMLGKALQARLSNGLVFCFTHAPLLSLPKDRTKGIEILFEESHSKASTPPNELTIWLGKYLSASWKNQFFWPPTPGQPPLPLHPCILPDAIERNQTCKTAAYNFFREKGYPQAGTANFKYGKRDNFLNFSCADGKVQKFFQLIAPSGDVLRQCNVVFSGHTHKVHEFRIQSRRDSDNFYFFIDDYSGSHRYTSESLPSRDSAHDRKMWLSNHQPLLVTSGGLKKKYPEFREIVVEGNNIKSMKLIRLTPKHPSGFAFQNVAPGSELNYEVFVREGDRIQHYYYGWEDGRWHRGQRFGSDVQSAPAAFQNGAAGSEYNYEVFVHEGNHIQHYYYGGEDGRWHKGQRFGSDVQSAPAAFQNGAAGSEYNYEVFVHEGNHIQHYYYGGEDGRWHKGQRFGSDVQSAPAAFQNGAAGSEYNYEVFVHEGNHIQHYYYGWEDGRWHKGQRFGSDVQSAPAAFQNGALGSEYNYEVFVHEGNHIQHYYRGGEDGRWHKGQRFGSDVQSAPAAFQNGALGSEYNYEVFVREGDYLQHYYYGWEDGRWHKGQRFGYSRHLIPIQISPRNGQTHYISPVALIWMSVAGAASYTVELYVQISDNWQLVTRKSDITTRLFSFNPIDKQTYHWRVWAVGADGKAGQKSDYWSFRYNKVDDIP